MRKQIVGALGIGVMCLLNMGCPGSSKTPTTTPGTTPSQGGGTNSPTALTAAQIAGNHSVCFPITNNNFGTSFNGNSFYRYLTIDASGSYNLDTFFFTGSSCIGGNEIAIYNQSGTFALGSLTAGGETEIVYSAASSSLTIYTGGAGASLWAALPGSACTSSVGTQGDYSSTGSGMTASESYSGIAGGSCASSGLTIAFPPNTQFYDLISLDSTSSPTTFTVSAGNQNQFYMGQYSSFPASATVNWTF